jgi:hypothetical protein
MNKIHTIKVAFCFVSAILSINAFRQLINVKSGLDNAPIKDVFITTEDTLFSTLTDEHGAADLSQFTSKSILILSHPSYQTKKLSYENWH